MPVAAHRDAHFASHHLLPIQAKRCRGAREKRIEGRLLEEEQEGESEEGEGKESPQEASDIGDLKEKEENECGACSIKHERVPGKIGGNGHRTSFFTRAEVTRR